MQASTNLLPAAVLMMAQTLPAFGAINTNPSPATTLATVGASQFGNAYTPLKTVEEQLAYVGSLGSGWDGGASVPIAECSMRRAKETIALIRNLASIASDPAVVPCADGSLQIEWHLADSRMEIYFETDGSIGAWWHDRATNEEREGEGPEAYSIIGRWAVRDAGWPKLPIAA